MTSKLDAFLDEVERLDREATKRQSILGGEYVLKSNKQEFIAFEYPDLISHYRTSAPLMARMLREALAHLNELAQPCKQAKIETVDTQKKTITLGKSELVFDSMALEAQSVLARIEAMLAAEQEEGK